MTESRPLRIAMWSGPRNLSTAMMYSFGARSDCAIIDEPFYAAYLNASGLDHPLRTEILAAQPTDPNKVISHITGSIPAQKQHFYQKHMTQRMVPGMPRDWMRDFVNVFLIRHPARVIASYAIKRECPTLDDIGFRQQAELFDEVQANGGKAIVIDSHDIRDDPERILRKLCQSIGLAWDPAMLNWPAGGHADDGGWAPHWYGSVWNSTGFAGAEGVLPEVPADLSDVLAYALRSYRYLEEKKIAAD